MTWKIRRQNIDMSNSISLLEISSSHIGGFEREYKNMSAKKGAQYVPMGIPTDCWKT